MTIINMIIPCKALHWGTQHRWSTPWTTWTDKSSLVSHKNIKLAWSTVFVQNLFVTSIYQLGQLYLSRIDLSFQFINLVNCICPEFICHFNNSVKGLKDWCWGLTDIQVPDIQLSDTQVPDTQAPGRPGPQTSRSFGHPGPWTSRSLDIQVFRTSRSFGRPGPWTSKSPDVQVFRTSRSFGRPGLSDVQVFRTSIFWGMLGFSKIQETP